MPSWAYLNPTAYGDLTGINKMVWIASFILGDSKFMTIFSILSGAGVILITEKSEERTGRSAGLHYRRNFWLLLMGLIHAHLIWYGDILVSYALCSLVVFLFRKMAPKTLLVIGILTISVSSALYLLINTTIPNLPEEAYRQTELKWMPSQQMIEDEIAAYTGTYWEKTVVNSAHAWELETLVFFILFFWRAGGLNVGRDGSFQMGCS